MVANIGTYMGVIKDAIKMLLFAFAIKNKHNVNTHELTVTPINVFRFIVRNQVLHCPLSETHLYITAWLRRNYVKEV